VAILPGTFREYNDSHGAANNSTKIAGETPAFVGRPALRAKSSQRLANGEEQSAGQVLGLRHEDA
jgi:hypothetical protein